MTGNYVAPDYGNHITQWQEWLEVTGLSDPADRYDPPTGPPVLFPADVTRYPMDTTR